MKKFLLTCVFMLATLCSFAQQRPLRIVNNAPMSVKVKPYFYGTHLFLPQNAPLAATPIIRIGFRSYLRKPLSLINIQILTRWVFHY